MILSNEPGYYKTDAYGIRIENLELVVGADIEGAEKPMNAFETLTLAPIDRRLIDVTMLSPDELGWLNDYHARVSRGTPASRRTPRKCGSTTRRRRCCRFSRCCLIGIVVLRESGGPSTLRPLYSSLGPPPRCAIAHKAGTRTGFVARDETSRPPPQFGMAACRNVGILPERNALLNLIFGVAGLNQAPLWLFGTQMIVMVANAFVMNNAAAGAISVRPEAAGTAAGAIGLSAAGHRRAGLAVRCLSRRPLHHHAAADGSDLRIVYRLRVGDVLPRAAANRSGQRGIDEEGGGGRVGDVVRS